MKPLIKSLLCCLTLILAITLARAGAGPGPLPNVGPFAGTASETWEVFTNGAISDLTPILGGQGFIGIANNAGIYQPGVANYSLGNGGNAQVSDGAKGFFSFNGSSGVVASTNLGLTEMGGYWGANLGLGSSATITVAFSDVNGGYYINTFNYTNTDGSLIWQGWSSPAPIITFGFTSDATDNGLVFDGLQANIVTVPEPSAVAVFGIGLIALIAARQLRAPRRQ